MCTSQVEGLQLLLSIVLAFTLTPTVVDQYIKTITAKTKTKFCFKDFFKFWPAEFLKEHGISKNFSQRNKATEY